MPICPEELDSGDMTSKQVAEWIRKAIGHSPAPLFVDLVSKNRMEREFTYSSIRP